MWCVQFGKRTCKPNSVVCGHSSRRRVTACAHQRPTRRFRPLLDTLATWTCRRGPCMEPTCDEVSPPESSIGAAFRCRAGAEHGPCSWARVSLPIWSCSVWGLPCLRHYCRSGALLPHLFTLATARGSPLDLVHRENPQWWYVFCGTGRPRALTPASRTLSGTLPCGVRTFLSRRSALSREAPAATARSSCQQIVYRGIAVSGRARAPVPTKVTCSKSTFFFTMQANRAKM
jgi:hypothetical protein